MAETLVEFQTRVQSPEGVSYNARACGAETPDGTWEGWLEFTPVDGGRPVHSARETTQPNRRDTEYWATGLSPIYLEGALQRALAGPPTVVRRSAAPPAFGKPAPAVTRVAVGSRESALDPFSVYAKGETLLRKQLGALSPWHLVNIAVAYDLTGEPADSLNRRPAGYLIELIVSGVRERQGAIEG